MLYVNYFDYNLLNNNKKKFVFLADGIILSEMFKIRRNYVRKEKIRISIGTWNINGDKNPALEHEYPSILDAWILDGPENISLRTRKNHAIPTMGLF
jgi:hypothetical protein